MAIFTGAACGSSPSESSQASALDTHVLRKLLRMVPGRGPQVYDRNGVKGMRSPMYFDCDGGSGRPTKRLSGAALSSNKKSLFRTPGTTCLVTIRRICIFLTSCDHTLVDHSRAKCETYCVACVPSRVPILSRKLLDTHLIREMLHMVPGRGPQTYDRDMVGEMHSRVACDEAGCSGRPSKRFSVSKKSREKTLSREKERSTK